MNRLQRGIVLGDLHLVMNHFGSLSEAKPGRPWKNRGQEIEALNVMPQEQGSVGFHPGETHTKKKVRQPGDLFSDRPRGVGAVA